MNARLQVQTLQLGAIGTNCYIAWREGSGRAVVVDPGDQAEIVMAALEGEGLTADAVLVTHCHWDHIGAVAPVAAAAGADVYMSRVESFVLEEDPNRFVPPGVGPFEPCQVTHKLEGGEHFEAAGLEFEAIFLPGHSPGTVGYLVRDGSQGAPTLFVGDLIFRGSVGRVDLPGASGEELLASAKRLFDTLPGETILLSGHGEPTTIEHEKRTNPLLRDLVPSQ